MSITSGTADAANPARPRYITLKVLALALIVLKIVSLSTVNLVTDEAYYWMWGQHPELSYYDHPPLNAWLIWISSQLFGHGLFQLRIWSLFTGIGTAVIFWVWAKRWAGENWEEIFWRTFVLWLATPLFGVYLTFATSDHLLYFFILLSTHFYANYLPAVREGGQGKLRDLYLGALFMGVTGLCKYNALFFGLALFAYIVASPRTRRLLRNPHLYVAAALVVAVASPVLIWNISNGFASFNYHLVTRHDAGFLHRIDLENWAQFFGETALAMTPFAIWGVLRFVFSRPTQPFERTVWGLGSWFFWLSTLTFLGIALTQQSYFWWNVSAYVLALPFLGKYMKGWVFWGHLTLGTIIAVAYVVSSTIVPVANLLDVKDPTRERYFGWNEIAEPIKDAIATYHPDFIASSKWESASVVGFALDRSDIVAINPRPNQYHYWFDKAWREANRGKNALIVVQAGMEKGVIDPQFEKLTEISSFPIVRQGLKMTSYQLYWGEGYKPSY